MQDEGTHVLYGSNVLHSRGVADGGDGERAHIRHGHMAVAMD